MNNRIDEIKFILGYESCVVVDRTGKRGGLALLWKKHFDCVL